MKIAILDALPEIYWKDDAGYTDGEKFRDMLAPRLPQTHFDIYYVAENQWPADIAPFDAIVASGSAASVHDDLDWIRQLTDLLDSASHQRKKIIGTCFSHQLIARLYGGEVGKNENGWLIGNHDLQIDISHDWMQPTTVTTSIHHFNQERVIRLPGAARSFARSQQYDNFAYTIDDHILCVQGHPEQSTKSIQNWLESTENILSDAEIQRARARTENAEPDTELWAGWFAEFLRG